jgi:hypothetical protein
MAASDVQQLYTKSRLHQAMQQVALISYIEERVLQLTLFKKMPEFVQTFFPRKLLA